MKKLGFAMLLMLLAPSISAADKTFPVGVPVETQALFCIEQADAQVIADAKGDMSPEIQVLMISGKCRQLSGVAVYVKVWRKDGWAVWELRSGSILRSEATDWKHHRINFNLKVIISPP